VDQLALSIDGVTAAKHDEFRKVEGTYAKVMQAAGWIREAGVPLQINSVVGAWNFEDFDAMVDLVKSLGVVFWEVFFLVPTGRGADLQSCSAAQFEAIFNKLMALAPTVPFVIKVTEGQHLRRLAAERGGSAPNLMLGGRPVNAGHGFCFVDHTGEVNPSGFLPIPCGNLKEKPLAEIYRSHPVFVGLRDFTKLKGKCGICRYRDLCSGGSRSRAYAVGGDIHAPEPFCIYEPAPDETPLVVPSSPPAAHPVLRGHPQGARHPGPART
jgi:radical SAM protein with 4Fe4S-binding SPASM domain